jgi:hypothetical protein
MKKYIVERVSDFTEGLTFHIQAPNMDVIKRWITETEKSTASEYTYTDGNTTIFAGNVRFIVKKWKEPNWLIL